MQTETPQKKHTLSLDNRESLILTGVDDVPLFDEQTVSVLTSCGNLVIKGSSLHITKLSLDIGEVMIDGQITAMQYLEDTKRTGMLRKLLR